MHSEALDMSKGVESWTCTTTTLYKLKSTPANSEGVGLSRRFHLVSPIDRRSSSSKVRESELRRFFSPKVRKLEKKGSAV